MAGRESWTKRSASLGERYGIPTEFSSYLVLEPGMNPRVGVSRDIRVRGGNRVAGISSGAGMAAPVAPPAAAEQRFEAAKAASAQRAATNMAEVDAASGLRDEATVRRLGN